MSASSQVTRTERLLNLVIALLAAHTPVSRQVVQSSVAGYDPTATTTAFERMFERDKDEQVHGHTHETVTDAHGEVLGYLIDTSEYVHRDVTFDADELMALNLAALCGTTQSWSATATTAVRKLESTGTIASLAPDAKAIPAFAHVSASDAALLPLMRAVRDRKVVRFSYRKPGADESTRRVDPWSLHAEGGRWYLTGWDHERTSARTFRVSRIEGSVTLTAESTTTERSAAPTASSEESEEASRSASFCRNIKGRSCGRHPTLRPSGTGSEADGSRQAPVFTIHDSPRRALRCCGVRIEVIRLSRARGLCLPSGPRTTGSRSLMSETASERLSRTVDPCAVASRA